MTIKCYKSKHDSNWQYIGPDEECGMEFTNIEELDKHIMQYHTIHLD